MTVTNPAPTRAKLLSADVNKRVWALQSAFLAPGSAGNAEATATLARLRRCALDEPGADPSVWQVTLADLPDELRWDNASSPGERAVHAALVLYAMHQQSNAVPVYRVGVGLGEAVRQLALARGRDGKPDQSTISRLHQVALAGDSAGQLYHLRGLIALLHSESPPIALDHAQLAVDLWRLFDPFQDSNRVVAQWGRDLHNKPRSTTTGEPQ
jgi:CRISPR system Cascade subunit CasB